MKFSVIIRMRNNVVSCANKTVKLNVLHPCVDTLKKKLQAFELQHMVVYFIEGFKEASTHLLPTQPTTWQFFYR